MVKFITPFEEIIFWKNNIKIINKRVIKEYKIPSLFVYSDASNLGLASVYKEKCKDNYTDNYACSLIARKVSKKPNLHDLALEIHKISSTHNIELNVC